MVKPFNSLGQIIKLPFLFIPFLTFLFNWNIGYCQSSNDLVKLEEDNLVIIERRRKETIIKNETRFQLFKENLEKNKKDKFKIQTYTIEGDPIIYKVKFKGESVVLKENSRRDRYGGFIARWIIIRKKISVESAKRATTPQELISVF